MRSLVLLVLLAVSSTTFAAPARIHVIVAFREPVVYGKTPFALFTRVQTIRTMREQIADRIGPEHMSVTARWEALSGFAAVVDEAGLDRLRSDPDVVAVGPDVPIAAHLAESIPLIHGDYAQNQGFFGSETIAVLDTGVENTHPDLQPAIVDEACFCTNLNGSGCCPNGNTSQTGSGAANDDNGHGTNVAGIIASRGVVTPKGVSSGSSLVVIKVLDRNAYAATTAQVISGINYLVNNHREVRVMNMSFGTQGALFAGDCDSATAYNYMLSQAVYQLKHYNDAVVVASSGNDGSSTLMASPACLQQVVSVGAVYDSTGWQQVDYCSETASVDHVTCFSNASTTLKLLAPGSAITSSGLGGGASTYSGTSQAAAHVAGAAALVLGGIGHVPNASGQAETALKSTGTQILDTRNGLSFPRIDIQQALYAASPCTLVLTSPNGYESWTAGTTHTISWETHGTQCGSTFRIDLVNGASFSTITSSATGTSYDWTIPANQQPGSAYKIRIYGGAYNGLSQHFFSITAGTCTLSFTQPLQGDTFLYDVTSTISWTASGTCGLHVQLDLFRGVSLATQLSSSTSTNASYLWMAPNTLPSSPEYRLRVTDTTTGATAWSGYFVITGAPANLKGSWDGTREVLTWESPGLTGHYRVLRRDVMSGSLVEIGTQTNDKVYFDTSAEAGVAYLYAVQRYDSAGNLSPNSNVIPAVALAFTDDPLTIATVPVKRVHVTELRDAINALRVLASLSPVTFTDPTPVIVRAVHVTELRTAANDVRDALGYPAVSFTGSVSPGGVIKAIHLQEIRDALR